MDAPGTLGDKNRGCGAFFPIKPWVVAYDAATFAPGGRGELAMPTLRAFKGCVVCFKTLLVDGFRKAMVHAGDNSMMKRVWSRRKQATARVFTWCGSTKGKFVNRGLHAALNLRSWLALFVR